MLKIFRVISILEGLSFLAILSVTLNFISRDFVSQLGMIHGVLFMLYVIILLIVSDKQKWSVVIWVSLFIASIVPFAFIAVEIFLSKAFTYKKQVDVSS
jgi:integral membrane protein